MATENAKGLALLEDEKSGWFCLFFLFLAYDKEF